MFCSILCQEDFVDYQRARLAYQFGKLESVRNGIYPEHGGNVEFELFSFFEICHHLKDWVKEESPEHSINVEKFIKASPALRITADICNRLKHKVLRDRGTQALIEHKKSKAPLGPFRITVTTVIGPDPSMAKVTLSNATIATERGEECCFALAQECMSEWAHYFTENKRLCNN
jgi:hypothetical protein